MSVHVCIYVYVYADPLQPAFNTLCVYIRMNMFIYIYRERGVHMYVSLFLSLSIYIYMGVSMLFIVQKGSAGIDRGTSNNAYRISYNKEVPRGSLNRKY